MIYTMIIEFVLTRQSFSGSGGSGGSSSVGGSGGSSSGGGSGGSSSLKSGGSHIGRTRCSSS